MLKIVEKGLRAFGRPPKLSRADQLLMTLMYWREYRTEIHIAQSYGVSEATVCRTIHRVEDTLVRSKKFRLPGGHHVAFDCAVDGQGLAHRYEVAVHRTIHDEFRRGDIQIVVDHFIALDDDSLTRAAIEGAGRRG